MILPKIPTARIDKGKFSSIVENLANSKFTGFVKIAYRRGELSVAEILFDQGKMLAAEVTKVKSKRSVAGDAAIEEVKDLGEIVAEIYALSPEEVRKIFDINRNFEVKEKKLLAPTKERTEFEVEAKVKKESALGNSEVYSERQKIIEKYGIRVPKEEEIDQIIANALGDEIEEIEKNFEIVKSNIIEILETKLGKPAKKAIEIVSSCKNAQELSQNAGEIGKALKTLIVFIPRKRVEEVIAEIEQKIGIRLG